MIRKVYFQYLRDAINREGFLSLIKYGYRYVSTYLSYQSNRSLSGPIQGTLCLTYNCNLTCEMCDLPQRHALYSEDEQLKVLSLSEWYGVIDDFSKIKTSGIAISGGEPLLHKDLFPIIKHIKNKKMLAQITSNGWFITEEVAEKLILSGLDSISISLDGDTKELHDKIRGIKGSFDKAIKAISNLDKRRREMNSKLTISVSTTFGKSNYHSINKVIDVARNAGADRIGFIPVHTIAPLLDESKFKVTAEDKKNIFSKINELQERARKDDFIETSERYLELFHSFFEDKPLPHKCMAGFTTLVIDCYGKIFPCFSFYQMEKPWANIKEHKGLYNFWKSKNINTFRSEISGCRECYWNCQVETNLIYSWK